jgi:outer membrane PBP1 activator LpoA protein
MRHPLIRLTFILLVLASLGCVKKTSTQNNQITENKLQTTAKQFVAKGDYLGASQTYRKLANATTKVAQRESYRASSLEYLLRANRLDSVRRDLHQFNPTTPSVKTRVNLIQAQLALSDQQSQRALDLLKQIQPQTLGKNARRNYHTLSALSLEAQNKPILVLYERLHLDAWGLGGLIFAKFFDDYWFFVRD